MHSTIKLNKKNSKEYSLSLKFNPNQKPKHFISYLESLLDIKKNPLSSTIHFKCYKVETLKELLTEKKNNLSYRHLLLMFLQLGQQLKELTRDKIGILKINNSYTYEEDKYFLLSFIFFILLLTIFSDDLVLSEMIIQF